eukprot:TRINITY_DN16140_c0_g1_i1.p1 TRINITY_DN16140_c0_g1~~TRINITY_DN16140_c0_g1_i1.p1  ORF type:complete len:388 (-),score=59.84 TRINITY_DN16140_c0_g1_i1:92-1255(-)
MEPSSSSSSEHCTLPLKPGRTLAMTSVATYLAKGLSWLGCKCAPRPWEPIVLLEGDGSSFRKLYDVDEQIGQGAFGKVFACRDITGLQEDERLCVKVLPLKGRKLCRVHSIREEEKFQILCKCLELEHPNIVRYRRFVQTSDALYVVMDRSCGPDLVDYVDGQGGKLPIGEIRTLASQVLSAVGVVHGLGMMHRDIKPENFKFKESSAEALQLLDFGFAKAASGTPAQHTVLGTLTYTAPEVFDGVYCEQCDLWSVGVVLYQLFCGNPPFESSDVTILRSLHRDPLLTGSSLFRGPVWRSAPEAAQDLVRGLLTVDPAKRSTAHAALADDWLVLNDCPPAELSSCSALRRDASSISVTECMLTRQRSYFVWDVSEALSDAEDGEERL